MKSLHHINLCIIELVCILPTHFTDINVPASLPVTCHNGMIIAPEFVCDGSLDCPYGEDEARCNAILPVEPQGSNLKHNIPCSSPFLINKNV